MSRINNIIIGQIRWAGGICAVGEIDSITLEVNHKPTLNEFNCTPNENKNHFFYPSRSY